MAITDYTTYKSRLDSPRVQYAGNRASLTTVAGRTFSGWLTAPEAGAAPTTAAACTNATKGAIGTYVASNPIFPLDGSNQRLLGLGINNFGATRGGLLIVADRLSHQGGQSGIVTTVDVATNLPTAALTRYTNGVGVMIGLEIYTQIGATGTTITAKYTNTADTAGRVTPLTVIGNTGFREASRFIILPLQAGDVGVKSIQSQTLTVTTGTAGAYGYTLFKPLAVFPMSGLEQGFMEGLFTGAQIPELVTSACLMFIYITPGAATGALNYNLLIAED